MQEKRRATCVARRLNLQNPGLAVVALFAVFGEVEAGHFDFLRRAQTDERLGDVGATIVPGMTSTSVTPTVFNCSIN